MPIPPSPQLRHAHFLACVVGAFAVMLLLASEGRGASEDRTPPSLPTTVIVLSATPSSITVTWAPANDNVAVSGYDAYVNLAPVGHTSTHPYTFSGLACGSTFSLGLATYDAAGNRSERVRVVASTAACAASSPVPDATPPSTPGGLAVVAASHDSISLSWQPASDNVGVAGYEVFGNGILAGRTPARGLTLNGLSCGQTHSFAVAAYDAAGNRSGRSSVIAATSPCAGSPPAANTPPAATVASPPPPQPASSMPPSHSSGGPTRHTSGTSADVIPPTTPLVATVGRATTTSVFLTWTTSWDNVGVAGYGIYVNGVRVGSASSPGFTLSGLSCATTYTFGIDAFDGAGNQSAPIRVTASTAPCAPGGGSVVPVAGVAVYVAAGGSDANCVRADVGRPCATLDRAYELANRGEVVQIAGGTYAGQQIFYRAEKESGNGVVSFVVAPGASIAMTSLRIRGGRYISIDAGGATLRIEKQFDVTDNGASAYARDVTLNRASAGLVTINRGVSNVRVSNGEIGPWTSECGGLEDSQFGYTAGGTPPSNIYIVNNYIHDMRRTLCATEYTHTDCLQIEQVNGMTISGNTFARCTSDALLAKADFGPIANLTFENNMIGGVNSDGTTPYSVGIFEVGGNKCRNVVVRNNSFGATANDMLSIGCATSGAGAVVVASNLFASASLIDNTRGGCPGAEATMAYNVWEGTPRYTCGSNAASGAVPNYPNRQPSSGKPDLHIGAGSARVIDSGSRVGGQYSADDYDGRARFQGAAADAGAHEAG